MVDVIYINETYEKIMVKERWENMKENQFDKEFNKLRWERWEGLGECEKESMW